MGYATRYTLKVWPESARGRLIASVTASEGGYSPFDEPCKWYEHDDHMCAATQSIPCVAQLDGEGEDSGDVWRKLYCDGALVWQWRLDPTIPDPPAKLLAELRNVVDAHAAKQLNAARQARIAELEAELETLKAEPF